MTARGISAERVAGANQGPAGRAGWVPATVTALAGLVAVYSVWRDLQPAITVAEPTRANTELDRLSDFRDANYFPVQELLAGGNPYRPDVMLGSWPVGQTFNLYQPYHLALHLPFGLGSYSAGAVAFSVVSVLLLVGLSVQAAVVLRRWVPVPLLTGSAVLSALMLFGELGKAQLYVGQINPLIAVGAAGALIARRTHPGWASVALGVAWIKPQFGLPLALLLAVRGSPRVALAGTGVAAVASLPVAALLVVREGGVGGFLDSVGANLAHAQTTSYGAFDSPTTFRIDLVAALFRVTGWAPPAAELVAFVLVLGTSALALRALARCERADPTNAAAAGVLADLLIGLAVVTAVVHQPGDLLITFPATIAAAGMWWWIGSRTGSGGEAARVGVSRPLLAVAIGLIAVPYLHVYQVGNVLAAVFGLRVAGAVDGVAASAAWVVVLVLAARLPSRARQIADAVTTTASGTRNHR